MITIDFFYVHLGLNGEGNMHRTTRIHKGFEFVEARWFLRKY